jgi:hypothetical protein
MPKKNNPGCNCCDECDRCTFKCDGSLCPTICGIRINIPEPDSVPVLTGNDCPPDDECPDSSRCVRCYTLFDKLFSFFNPVPFWDFQYVYPGYVFDCNDVIFKWTLSNYNKFTICWNAEFYDCYLFPFAENLCGAKIGISDSEIQVRTQWNPETRCGKITATIMIKVFEAKCVYPIGEPLKEATFTHLFELDYCTCDEMMAPIPFVSTTVENPHDLPEPCNLDQATLSLYDAETGLAQCPNCSCWECSTDNTVNVAISGPGFSGTIPLSFVAAGCSAYGSFILDCEGNRTVTVRLFVGDCSRCEYYNISVTLSTITAEGVEERAVFRVLDYLCGQDVTLELLPQESFSPKCNLDEYAVSL